jgi:hypothetical protein
MIFFCLHNKVKVGFIIYNDMKNKKIPTKIFIDYDKAKYLADSMGVEKMLDWMRFSIIVSLDTTSYFYLNELKNYKGVI